VAWLRSLANADGGFSDRPGWLSNPLATYYVVDEDVTTEVDGSFKIEFTARPDLKIAETDEPTFVFQINTDVTDSAGETRSAAQTVRVGYTALEATLGASDWQTVAAPG
jgi:hypothetical protein